MVGWCSGNHVDFGSREIRVWEEKPGSWVYFSTSLRFLVCKMVSIKIRDDSGKSFWVCTFWIHLLGRHNSLPLVWKDADFCRVAFLIVKKLTHAWGFLPSGVGISIQPRSEFTGIFLEVFKTITSGLGKQRERFSCKWEILFLCFYLSWMCTP